MCGAFQIYRTDKCIIRLVTTVLPLSSSRAATGCCIPKIIISNPSSELKKSDSESESFDCCLSLNVTAHQIVSVSWPVCLAFIKFCFHLLLSESLKILTVSDRTVLYEVFKEILQSKVIIFFLPVSTKCFSPALFKNISGGLSKRVLLRFTLSDS